jgi:protein-L-isoaspartate(D-aspartate) O-methyltransferase
VNDAWAARRRELVATLRAEGVRDDRVLRAMGAVERHRFLPAAFADRAYENAALPIGQGQTISQPLVVALMTEALAMPDRLEVLEIGTGSGYQTAVLARLCRRVFTIERHRPLHEAAVALFGALKLHNVDARLGDGTQGWPEHRGFDRIMITAAAEGDVPRPLLGQLGAGGVLVSPVTASDGGQHLVRLTREADGFRRETLGAVRFVPLVPDTNPSDVSGSSNIEEVLRQQRRARR